MIRDYIKEVRVSRKKEVYIKVTCPECNQRYKFNREDLLAIQDEYRFICTCGKHIDIYHHVAYLTST